LFKQSEVNVNDPAGSVRSTRTSLPQEKRHPTAINAIGLILWLAAGATAFLPFAFDTSPWDAVTLRVPGNQGNWWHFLAGAPFFLAFPVIWLRLRSLAAKQPSTAIERRAIWTAVALSISGTMAVETPFLLHLAGTSDWQRLTVLGLGCGIAAASAAILFSVRKRIAPTPASLAALDTAYLANASLCLVVYSGAAGNTASKLGWFVSMAIVWPILLELIWLYLQALPAPSSPGDS
jgi:hypothetical protein